MQTVLDQDFDDYELVVCDNCGSHETREVVKGFTNKNIKYIRSEIPLSMSENWELAIENSSGRYVIVIGDDDGLIKGSLAVLYNIIKETGYLVVRWDRVYYSWSNLIIAELANQLTLPFNIPAKVFNGREIIEKVISFNIGYTLLPMLYNSAISRELIDELKSLSGRIFRSVTPDIYSGFAFAYLSGEYLSLPFPVTINGAGPKSNGVACNMPANSISNEFQILNKSSSLAYHDKLPFIRNISSIILEAFFQLHDALDITGIPVDMQSVFTRIIRELKIYDDRELKESIKLIREACAYDPQLLHHVEQELAENPMRLACVKREPFKKGFFNSKLVLDASEFGLGNIAQVAGFVEKFYDYSVFDLPVNQKNHNSSRTGNNYIKKLYRRLQGSICMLIKGHV